MVGLISWLGLMFGETQYVPAGALCGNCLSSPRRSRGRLSVHAPFPGVKTNRWDQLSSEPMAQGRPAPRENPLLGYKLTWVRAMPVENRATPWQNGTESPGGEVKTAWLQWQEHINSPQDALVCDRSLNY